MILAFALLLLVVALFATGFVKVDDAPYAPPATSSTCAGDCVPRAQLVAAVKLSTRRLRGWRYEARRAYGYKRTLLHRPDVTEAINLACTVYGHCAELWRKARCETGGTFSPYSKNKHSTASGLFQFLTSTWAGIPFGRYSIWSPYANALGAGYMHAHGRGGEWVCQ